MSQKAILDAGNPRQMTDETSRAQDDRRELVERIARAIRHDGQAEPLRGLHLYRVSSPGEPVHGMSDLTFCVIAQGSKEVYLGEECYRYDPYHYLLTTVKLPIMSRIIEASPERPYLGLRLELDPALVCSVMAEAGYIVSRSRSDVRAISVSPLDAGLLDAVVRLVALADSPAEARFLMPLITREIIYRLLMGEQGDRLRHIAVLDGHVHRIVKVIERLRHEFDQPLRVESLASELSMSVSSFHHHFKTVTGMSPLQFQKRLRLQEARRLMLGEHLDATSAAYRVGYDDVSHFSREYKRLFGLPPLRDVGRLREVARQQNGLNDD